MPALMETPEMLISRTMGNRALALLLAALLTACVLAGCAASTTDDAAEAQAQAVVDDLFSAIQDGDYEEADELIAASYFDSDDYGVSAGTFDRYYFADFAYTIDAATYDGDNQVTVSVTLSAPQMAAVLDDMLASQQAAEANGADVSKSGYADKAFAKRAKAAEWDSDEMSVDIALACTDGSDDWEIVTDRGMLGAILLDGYDMRQILDD